MEINILIDKEFKTHLKIAWLRKVIRRVLEAELVSAKSEVSLVITGDERVHLLNKQYLEEDRPTDVLSFPMNEQTGNQVEFVDIPDGKHHLGDIIISYPQAIKQAEEHRHSVNREIAILMIHGILHLLGYDHDIPERKKVMNGKETDILRNVEEQNL